MKLNFLVNDNYLIAHTLSSIEPSRFSSKKYQKDIVSFQNFAWGKSERLYNLIVGKLSPDDISHIENLAEELPDFLKTLKMSSQYKKILSQTQNYLIFCEKQWAKNYPLSSEMISALTGFNLDKSFTIYLTHPSLKNGRNFGNSKISWGHNEDWVNYTTVYLWHEILHSYFINNDFNHAVIQLVADNELRAKLNKEKYPPFIGHKNLFPLMKKLLPHWRRYLKNKKPGGIEKFANTIIKLREFSIKESR